jgi:hypothetical protein
LAFEFIGIIGDGMSPALHRPTPFPMSTPLGKTAQQRGWGISG